MHERALAVRAHPVQQALGHLRVLADWAYEHGFHELGYDPVDEVERALLTAPDGMSLFCSLDWIVTYEDSYCPACLKDRCPYRPLAFNDPAAHEIDCAVQPYLRALAEGKEGMSHAT